MAGWLLVGSLLAALAVLLPSATAQAATVPQPPATTSTPGPTPTDATRPPRAVEPAEPPAPGTANTPAATDPGTTPEPTTAPTTAPAPGTAGGAGGNTNNSGALGPLDAADTHDLTISSYQLSVDTGGPTNMMKLITNGIFLQGLWEAYRWTVGAGVAIINLTLQMQWVDWIVDAINPLATTLKTDVVDRLGILNLTLAAMGVWVAVILAIGKYARGISQLIISTAIAALATGVLANPVAAITGPDGLLYSTRDAGQAVSTVITSNGKSSDPDPQFIQEQTGAALVDTFVRAPHQMINYGQVIDGTSCQQAYDDALAGGPYDSDDDSARSAVGDCNEDFKDFADDPGWSGVAAIAILTPAGGALVVLAIVLAILVLLAVLTTLFCAVKLIIDLPLAIYGSERAGLWSSVISLLGALLVTGALLVLLAMYCLFLRGVLAANNGSGLVVRFLIIDILLIAFIITTITARKRITERAQKLARKAAAFTGGNNAKPVQMPKMSHARQAAGQFAATRSAMGRAAGAAGGLGSGTGGAAGGPVKGNAASRVLQRVANNRLVKTGLTAASLAGGAAGLAAKATLGAPVYGPRAARVVKAATRARAASAKATVTKKAATGKANGLAFAKEYRDGLSMAARPAVKVGRAAAKVGRAGANTRPGRAATKSAAEAATAATIRLSSLDGSQGPTPRRPLARTSTRNGVTNSPRRAAEAQRRQQRARAEEGRATQIPRSTLPVPPTELETASARLAERLRRKRTS